MAKPQTVLSPTLQVMVTGFALFVGFFCGMMISMMTIRHGIDLLREAHQAEAYDHELILSLAHNQPETYQALIDKMQPIPRGHILQIVAADASARQSKDK